MFDDGGMTAPPEWLPDWVEHPDLEEESGGLDAARQEADARFRDAVSLPEPVPPPDLDDPEPPMPTVAQLDAWVEETDAPQDEAPPEPAWAVPGAEPEGSDEASGAGLSARSEAALAEAAEAVRALRLGGARLYRAITELEAGEAVAETGYRNLSRLLEDHVRLDTGEVKRLARHAAALRETVAPTGGTVPADLPATAAAVHEGWIGEDHVEVIRLTMKRVATVDDVAPEVLATTERVLAELAASLSPKALGASAKVIADRLDPDGAAPDDDPPPENELRYVVRRNGALHGTFVFGDPLAAELFATALAAATPPPESDAVVGDDGRGPEGTYGERGESPDAHAARSRPARQAAAMLDLAAEALDRGLDEPDGSGSGPAPSAGRRGGEARENPPEGDASGRHAAEQGARNGDGPEADPDVTEEENDDGPSPAEPPPAAGPEPPPAAGPERPPPGRRGDPPRRAWTRPDIEGGERIALTVTLDFATLRQQLDDKVRALALLGDSTWIRPETARMLACDAELIPMVLGSRSEVLDVGRRTRIVPLGIRRAIVQRDRHCAHPGCRRKARKCQAHHIVHWADDGETAVDNLVLLCAYHHSLVHRSGWEIVMTDGLPYFIPPAWLDPLRTPRHNRAWQTV